MIGFANCRAIVIPFIRRISLPARPDSAAALRTALRRELNFCCSGYALAGADAVYLLQPLNFKAPVKIGDVVILSIKVIAAGRRAKIALRVRGRRRSGSRR
jgi:acyl dehydratase